jgi:hypothetical protein
VAHLGGSITSGALTTFIGSIFLCCGTITFFRSFGIFLMEIVALSLGATFFSFACTLYLFGPEGSFCQIPCASRRGCARGSQPEDTETNGPTRDALTDKIELHVFPRKVRWSTGAVAVVILLVGGAIRLWLSLRSDDSTSVTCPDITELEFTFENFNVPEEQDSYRCRGFDAIPSTCTYYVTEVEPMVKPEMMGTVHHMILYGIEGAASSCPYTCFDMPHARDIVAAWAIGQGPLVWPSGTALPIGGFKLDLQVHYENALLTSGIVDTKSGLKLKLTSTKPENQLSTLGIGLQPLGDLTIPGGQANVTRYVECTPQLTGEVTAVAYATHAHKLGFSVISEVRRTPSGSGSGSSFSAPQIVGDVGSTPNYDFNFQNVQMFAAGQERQLLPGDTVRITCSYDSTSRWEPTHSGYGSADEMCMTFLFVYPSSHVGSKFCFSNYAFEV